MFFKQSLAAVLLVFALGAAAQERAVNDLLPGEAREVLPEARQTLAQRPQDARALKTVGILLHQVNRIEPDRTRVEEGEQLLKQASQLNPQDLETTGWLGSITTMKALFESDPGKQTFYVKLGTRMLDKAVLQAPDNPVLRLIRAYNSMELPVFLKRTRYAVEDFQYYLDLCDGGLDCDGRQVSMARERLTEARRIVAEQG